MLRYLVLSAGLIAASLYTASPSQASDTCQRYTGGRCKAGQTSPPRISSGAVSRQEAPAPAKGNHKGRDEYTAAQREKIMTQAREVCRRKYGAPSRVYRIDYKKFQVWCEPPSY